MVKLINENFILKNGLNWIYRVVKPGDRVGVGTNKVWGMEAIRINDSELPVTNGLYLVPAELTNHLGKTIKVLATCNPLHQQVSAPFYLISKERKLVEAEEGGFIDSKLGYSLTHHTLFKDSAPESKLYLKSCA